MKDSNLGYPINMIAKSLSMHTKCTNIGTNFFCLNVCNQFKFYKNKNKLR